MEENFDYIVRKYYNRLREPFLQKLTGRYPSMRLDTAKDLYQDAFFAVHEKIMRGEVSPDINWNAYILKTGLNMAWKNYHSECVNSSIDTNVDDSEDGRGSGLLRMVEDKIRELTEAYEPLCKNPVVLSHLGEELAHTPDPCGKIIRLFYYEGKKFVEIAKLTGFKNAQTAKAKKSQCMTDLIKRITKALRDAGINITPKKRNRNGKN